MKNLTRIQTHDLDSVENSIIFRNIIHKNSYDITQLHRHSYFEIMFFQSGGGVNHIDFNKYEVKSNACYLISPGQTHLFKKSPSTYGKLIQFKQSAISSLQLQHLLQQRAWSGTGAVLFEDDGKRMERALSLLDMIATYIADSSNNYSKEIKQHLLHALLQDLCSSNQERQINISKDPDFFYFQQLIDEKFKEEQKVAFYLKQMAISEKKLSLLTKKHLGLSPLQVIHARVLLEA
ncbi:MAG: AraC family ligand binding domain-containing protein, partial [Flavobacteriales bacterium]|nr:AraC family ligand binding domain-containing protein [Flavobacteriales bacterium]